MPSKKKTRVIIKNIRRTKSRHRIRIKRKTKMMMNLILDELKWTSLRKEPGKS